jgi:predicted secreted hydrolase
VIFGQDGISRKSATSNAASHYVTFTRLRTEGTVELLGETFTVEGETWMDHEFSSSQLSDDQTGWDWASIRLNDGRDIMLYRLRQRTGGADPFSQLTWVDQESQQTQLKTDQWSWKARRQWTSPHTNATYPIDIDVETIDPESGETRRLRLRPLVDDQEIVGKLDSLSYWEGACDVLDESDTVIGQAYVELAGYDGRLTERLR